MSKNELWSLLQQSALVEGDLSEQNEKHSPWFVRAMLGVAGWLGAMFLVGFVGTGLSLATMETEAYWVIGAFACGGAAAIFRLRRNGDFSSQFGLAVAIAGQVLMMLGMGRWISHSSTTVAFIVAVQQAILFVAMPNFVHRVWAAGTSALALCIALGGLDLHALILPLLTAGLAVAWLREFKLPKQNELVRACGYGITLTALIASYMNPGEFDWTGYDNIPVAPEFLQIVAYAGAALIVAVMIGATLLLLQREKVSLTSGAGKAALALAIVLALASIKAPGLAPGALILLLGFANGNRVLTGLGVLALLAYLSYYYYALHITLLEKSVIMMLTGTALLGLRFASHHWWPALNKEETTHA
ncbi:DUF4401 domain-containing protein [Roseimicrobium sp. ORNL1]|uniref:DUF4401 domain-containing protein n=1 Tax=Roseimicrobium sp. ORNL1 TaxID=2711231 RepID=UPI0013E13C4E|nr:DUF4401 domain-containing protein [Roseimicrobium sp. ORNL1]QIF04625.1 DUF4401 domain-containing protein [Roseimicrobium sp. ORNL1]